MTTILKNVVFAGLLLLTLPGLSPAQMSMNPYFTAINYPLDKNSLMLMVLPDYPGGRCGWNPWLDFPP